MDSFTSLLQQGRGASLSQLPLYGSSARSYSCLHSFALIFDE